MKNTSLKIILFLSVISAFTFVSCKKNKTDDKTKSEIESNVQSGELLISTIQEAMKHGILKVTTSPSTPVGP
ncbi:MAG: hypothetical protein P8M61_08715 [Crocinitomicaceae bacterium]|nr:hypothetical protein [Crocinitomicaceae bacterium]MDG2465154.1 hypothetical protein [Crocinitomicaceae bacterium]